MHLSYVAVAAILASTASCQTSSASTISSSIPTPSVAPGFSARRVASGLETPRGIIFDNQDTLLTVQRGLGVVAIAFDDNGSDDSVAVKSMKTVVADDTLNHGIALSSDGRTLYASSTDAVFSYGYDAMTMANTSAAKTLISNMTTSDHTTRTLLLSKQMPGMLIVTRGSTSNVDPEAELLSTGHSQIKAFNLDNMTGIYDFNTDGMLLGWGLRNDVGIAEHPTTGGLYSVENSVDQMMRNDVDIHATNPGEELNYLGTLANNTSPNQGSNFGYPQCYSAWDPTVIPENTGLKVGMQFAIGTLNSTNNDTFCQQDRTAPRLVFEAHMAPLDIKFNNAGTEAWVAFHGSWNRSPLSPSGYKVSAIPFTNGEPTAASDSTDGYIDIVSNMNNDDCPDKCFRPVGLAWDSMGRLFFSSDATGEIYMITRDGTTNGSVMSATPTPTGGTAGATGTPENSAMAQTGRALGYVSLAAIAVAAFLF